jgi:hypothetical protein
MKRAQGERTTTAKATIGRRGFLKTVPAAIAAGVAVPSFCQQPQQAQTPNRFGKDVLKQAEQVAGLSFTDAEEEMMLRGVNRNLESYETLRKLDIPLDTEPAIAFHPYLPGPCRSSLRRRSASSSRQRPRPPSMT